MICIYVFIIYYHYIYLTHTETAGGDASNTTQVSSGKKIERGREQYRLIIKLWLEHSETVALSFMYRFYVYYVQLCLVCLLSHYSEASTTVPSPSTTSISRPAMVTRAIESNTNLYYFGIGSNMLKSKLEGRGVNNTNIEIISIEPGVAKRHRLAFNMKGFVPLEPAMGGCEPCDNDDDDEMDCHGALCEVTPENYDKKVRRRHEETRLR